MSLAQIMRIPLLLGLLVLSCQGDTASPIEPPRRLTSENAGAGLFMGMNHRFTSANYWDYGNFAPQQCCELPGKLFRATANGESCSQAYVESGNEKWYPGSGDYALERGVLYGAWRVKVPDSATLGGKYSHVRPAPGPWEVWIEKSGPTNWAWHIAVQRDGKLESETIDLEPLGDGWYDVRIALKPKVLQIELNRKLTRTYRHDAYNESFRMRFGSSQPAADASPVVSDFRYVFFDRFPYPYSAADRMPEGPEDIEPSDHLVRLLVARSTPQSPRHSEGSIIKLKDGGLMLVWSDYFSPLGYDGSPSRLSAKVTRDGGKSWSESWTVVESTGDGPRGDNIMSASLLRAGNGDILLAYYGRRVNGVENKGMLLRRSQDEGKTWSDARAITPNTGNRHVANNDALRMLKSGRIVLACREYTKAARLPYALYSDDDGLTWQAGAHVPPADITPYQRKVQNLNEPIIAQVADGRLFMMMRTVAGGHFFSYSSTQGETWSKPYLSPLRGVVAPPYLTTIPSTGDLLAIWSYGMSGRKPLNSAISRDGGKTWEPVKLLEQSENYGYGYTSVYIVDGRAYITTMQYPAFTSLERFDAEPAYHDLLFLSLPVEWFYRMPN